MGALVLLLFLLASVVQIGAEWQGEVAIAFYAKTLLLPLLATAYTLRGGADRRMLGFFFGSWVGDVTLCFAPLGPGDVALLGVPKHDAWFLAGVLAFLLAHLQLIGALRDVNRPEASGPWTTHRWWFSPILAWAAVIGSLVLPPLWSDPVRWTAAPVLAGYAAVLHAMVAFALQRHGRVQPRSFVLTLVGAALFLLSDSLIGLVLLVHLLPAQVGTAAIMATYLAAEALIAEGMLAQQR